MISKYKLVSVSLVGIVLLVAGLSGYEYFFQRINSPPEPKITLAQAFDISRRTARERGYDMDKLGIHSYSFHDTPWNLVTITPSTPSAPDFGRHQQKLIDALRGKQYYLIDVGPPLGSPVRTGIIFFIDSANGEILWQVPQH